MIKKESVINIIQFTTILFWISFLKSSDSYFMPYLIVAVLAFICFYIKKEEKVKGGGRQRQVSVC